MGLMIQNQAIQRAILEIENRHQWYVGLLRIAKKLRMRDSGQTDKHMLLLNWGKSPCWWAIHHIDGVGGIMIQNDGKQDVFQQLHGWIHACFEL